MNLAFLKDSLWGLFFLLVQVILVRHLRVFNAEANLLWLYLIYLASTRDRTYSIVITALLSFLLDAFLDNWGLFLFANVLVVFLSYSFIPRLNEIKLLSAQVFIALISLSFFTNLIFFGVGNLFSLYDSNVHFWESLIGNSFYTAILGTFLYNFSSMAQGNT